MKLTTHCSDKLNSESIPKILDYGFTLDSMYSDSHMCKIRDTPISFKLFSSSSEYMLEYATDITVLYYAA